MVVGQLDGRLGAAARIAVDRASVRHADGIGAALAMLREDAAGTDLVIVEGAAEAADLEARLAAAGGITVPVVWCAEPDAAVARGPIPLPALPEAAASVLAAVADAPAGKDGAETAERGLCSAQAAHAALVAAAVTPGLVGRTVADVERDLILETLRRCFGNRTHAASILGISVRTLRNKLTVYTADGIEVPSPNQGEIRGAA